VDYYQFAGIVNAYCNKSTYSGSYSGGIDWAHSTVDVDFTAAKGEIIALFCGHEHWDIVDKTTLACPIISIIAAGAPVNTANVKEGEIIPTRYPWGTDQETSFDVVTINRKEKKIYCTRVGAGASRVVYYGDEDEPEVKTYTVTNTLTNCTTSNNAATVQEGTPYSATITANSGYTLDSVTVTMGGNPVAVSDGSINIASVTGNIVITAMAVEVVIPDEPDQPTNFADPSNTSEWLHNTRLNSSNTTACNGMTTTNYIDTEVGDIVTVSGIDLDVYLGSTMDGAVSIYSKSNKTSCAARTKTRSSTAFVSEANGVYTFSGVDGYIRFCGVPTNGDGNVVINIQRNGEWL
jgi:hypothetical protein